MDFAINFTLKASFAPQKQDFPITEEKDGEFVAEKVKEVIENCLRNFDPNAYCTYYAAKEGIAHITLARNSDVIVTLNKGEQ